MEGTPLKKIVQRIKQHGINYKIQELCLDQIEIVISTQQINNILATCINCELSSLINIPAYPNLLKLQLNNNNLSSDQLQHLTKYPKLYSLGLASNRIKDYSFTKYLKKTKLYELDLRDNPVCNDNQYRQTVYKLLGDLDILDKIDREGIQVQSQKSSDLEDEENVLSDFYDGEGDYNSSDEVRDQLQKKLKDQ